MELPEIVILIITYDRYQTLKLTLGGLRANLFPAYPDDKLHILVSDDSTGGLYLSNIRKLKEFKSWGTGLKAISTPERSGWGKHVNWALRYIEENYPNAKYVLQLEDDYLCAHLLDLNLGVALMEAKPDIGMLRYRGTAGEHAIFHQFEANLETLYPEYREAASLVDKRVTYLQVDSASYSLYSCYSNGVHLKRLGSQGFHAYYGYYPEGRKLGETEEAFAIWVKRNMQIPDAPAIAILPEWIPMRWHHIGQSWQGTAQDIGV